MAEPLSEHALETTLRVARVMFSHDMLPDIAYAKVVTALGPEAETVARGVAALDEGTPFLDLEPGEQLRSQAIPTGRQAWDGRDPGGSVPAPQELAA